MIADFGSNEPAIDCRARHELGDPLRPLRAHGTRVEAALAPDEPRERHGRQASRLGLLLHDGADDIDKGLRSSGNKSCRIDPGLDACDGGILCRVRRRRGEREGRKQTSCR
jgi:hypothetical protein